MIGVMLSAVCLSILADTPSGPVAFEVSMEGSLKIKYLRFSA